ncbi:MAG TPA: SDR family oxidoreductase [Nitrososphaeraceae archaeon]
MVTGASGSIGGQLVKQLSISKANFCMGVHSNDSKNLLSEIKGGDFVEIDYNKPDTISRACSNVDSVFLLISGPRALEYVSTFVNEAKKADVRHIVKLSHFRADSSPGVTITRLHRQVEKVIEDSEISYTFLRPNSFMQNFVNFYSPSIRSRSAFYVPGGDAKVSFVDVRDIASVAANILINKNNNNETTHINRSYDITGPEAISYHQAAEIISNTINRKISYINSTETEAREGMRQIGMNEWFINIALELYDSYRRGYASKISPTVEFITGTKPRTFVKFAKDYASYFNQNG